MTRLWVRSPEGAVESENVSGNRRKVLKENRECEDMVGESKGISHKKWFILIYFIVGFNLLLDG